MKLKLGISPCPNDTFMFARFIEAAGLNLDVYIEDIETLNQMAAEGYLDISKLSYHAFAKYIDTYELLHAGGALGENCGPLLVSKHKAYPDELADMTIAIPGKLTTAYLLMQIFFPEVKAVQSYVFSDIEEAVLSNACDAGLLIHETRFTYHTKGLKKILDLGELWEKRYKLPIPLGGIAAHRRLPAELKESVNEKLLESIFYAQSHLDKVLPFIRSHAQSLDDTIIEQHINLYVNSYSTGKTEQVKASVNKLLSLAQQAGLISCKKASVFIK